MEVNTSTFIGCDSDYHDSELIIFAAPFDSTTSYRPGARFASAHIRPDSYGLETYSPYLDADMEDFKICDVGDLDLPFGNAAASLDMIESTADQILKDKKIPFLIGGEHLVSLGSIRAVYKEYPDMVLLHFDAHADLREDYMGEQLSHASVIRRCWDFLGDGRIYQFCIRSGEKSEFEWAEQHTFMEKFDYSTLAERISEIGSEVPVYLTIDLDVLDPSIFPGTGTPEPGGIFFRDMMKIVDMVRNLNIVGADVVELAPHYDQSGVSTASAAKIIRELMLAILDR